MAAATPFRPKKWQPFETPLELSRARIMAADMPFSPAVLRKLSEKFHLGCTPAHCRTFSVSFTSGVHPQQTVALFHSSPPAQHLHRTATTPSRSQHLDKFRVRAAAAGRGAFARARLHTTRDYVTGIGVGGAGGRASTVSTCRSMAARASRKRSSSPHPRSERAAAHA